MSAHEALAKLFNSLSRTAVLTPGQARHLVARKWVERLDANEYALTQLGEMQHQRFLAARPLTVRMPAGIHDQSVYSGADLSEPPARKDAQDALKLPSRIGDNLVYRDDRIPIKSMGSMTSYVERKQT